MEDSRVAGSTPDRVGENVVTRSWCVAGIADEQQVSGVDPASIGSAEKSPRGDCKVQTVAMSSTDKPVFRFVGISADRSFSPNRICRISSHNLWDAPCHQ
jgi:hypothetical protein